MNRKPHVVATVALAGAVVPFGLFEPGAWLVAGGVVLGLVLHPDLDGSKTPYGHVRKHRGLSHWPVVGTLDRALWFLGPALAAWLATGRSVDWTGVGLLVAGLCLSDLCHIIMDKGERRWKKLVA